MASPAASAWLTSCCTLSSTPSSSFLGSLRRTVVRLDDGVLLSVQHDVSQALAAGDAIRFVFAGSPVRVGEDTSRGIRRA